MKPFALILFVLLSTACSSTPFEPTLLAAAPTVIAVTPVTDPTPEPAVVAAPVVTAPAPVPAPAPMPAPKPTPVATAPVNCQVSAWILADVSAYSACLQWKAGDDHFQHFRSEHYTRTITVQPSGGGLACPALDLVQIPYYDCTP